jgi:HK97 family phage major capsid protein
MNQIKHLKEERAKIQEQLDAIFSLCEKEKRSRNEEEKKKYDELKAKVDAFDTEINDLEDHEERKRKLDANQTPKQYRSGDGEPKEDMSIRGQVAAWQKRNADAVKKLKSGQRAELEPFEVRAANSPMTPANTTSDTVSFSAGSVIRMGGEVFDIHRTQPTFFDYLPKGRTGLENLPWVNKKVPASSGAAAFIGPGVAKPGTSFTFEVENSNAKKIAVSMKLATELLDDIDGMTTFVQAELAYQLKIKANTELMSGTLSSTNPAGVQTFSLGFTTSGLSTVNPNNWDCCRAVVAQIRKAFIDGQIVIFMNPIDTANMDMEKAVSQGTYMGLNIRQVPGAIIVEDYNISAGYIQAVVVDCLKTIMYKDFMLKFGWENDDFTKNLVTAIAEMRFHSYHSENDAAAFVYDDLADIKSQIAAA